MTGLVCATALAVAVAGFAQTPRGVVEARVRPVDTRAAALLSAGIARSPTFRALIEIVERSDLIVYVETHPMSLAGQLQLLAAFPGVRYLRVSIAVPGNRTDLVAWLAHELWHAVELAEAPDVRDQSDLLRLYGRIGGQRGDHVVESGDAQEMWTKVIHEMRRARWE